VNSARPIQFGVEMDGPFEGLTWVDSARELENMGYSTLFAADHFHEGYGPITALATAAVATTNLKLSAMVMAVDFRHPTVLARELASIDELSAGRLAVGLGAGYQIEDFELTGIPMDRPGARVDKLFEYVAVLKGLFAPGAFSFKGKYYDIQSLNGTPKPFKGRCPPFFLAGGGKRLLTFAALNADIIGVNPTLPSSEKKAESAADAAPANIDEKIGWIKDASGERFSQITIHAYLRFAKVTDDASGEAELLTDLFRVDAESVLSSPIILMGTVEEIVERLHERRERWGYSYFTVQQDVARDFASVIERLDN
jgi:probable F420-dependent oxidoreductase